jgi:hypothetical protein
MRPVKCIIAKFLGCNINETVIEHKAILRAFAKHFSSLTVEDEARGVSRY